jgi:O-antigen ligase
VDSTGVKQGSTPFLKGELVLIIIGALLTFFLTQGLLLLNADFEKALLLLLFPLLSIGALVAFTFDKFISFLFYLLAISYVKTDETIVLTLTITILLFFLVQTFSNCNSTSELDTLDWALITSILGLALTSALFVGKGSETFVHFSHVILIPFSILIIVLKLPSSLKFEERFPFVVVMSWALIGLGSLIFKLQHPAELRVSGYIQMSVTMIGYTSAALVPLAIHYATRAKAHGVNLILFVLVLIAMLLTNTRMAILMTGVACILNWRQLRKIYWLTIIMGIGAVILGVDILFTRFVQMANESFDISTAARFVGWMAGVSLIKQNWLLGIGFGEFQHAYLSVIHLPLIKLMHAHNLFLNKALDFGIPGAVLYISFIFRSIVKSLPFSIPFNRIHAPAFSLEGALALSLGIFLIAGLTDAILSSLTWSIWFFTLLGCMLRLRQQRLVDLEAKDQKQASSLLLR